MKKCGGEGLGELPISFCQDLSGQFRLQNMYDVICLIRDGIHNSSGMFHLVGNTIQSPMVMNVISVLLETSLHELLITMTIELL